jgi:RNA polymerase sigma factor (sigma-70 family)
MSVHNDEMATPEQTEIILKVARRLAGKYTFGYYSEDDIVQEAFLIAVEALPKYNPEIASLESFLYTHLNNRLQNFKRDNYFRSNYVCQYCNNEDEDCDSCKRRRESNTTKRHLMNPINIDCINSENEPNAYFKFDFINDLEIREIKSAIDKNLSVSLRADYLRMLDGIRLPKPRRIRVEEAILEIVEDYGAQ